MWSYHLPSSSALEAEGPIQAASQIVHPVLCPRGSQSNPRAIPEQSRYFNVHFTCGETGSGSWFRPKEIGEPGGCVACCLPQFKAHCWYLLGGVLSRGAGNERSLASTPEPELESGVLSPWRACGLRSYTMPGCRDESSRTGFSRRFITRRSCFGRTGCRRHCFQVTVPPGDSSPGCGIAQPLLYRVGVGTVRLGPGSSPLLWSQQRSIHSSHCCPGQGWVSAARPGLVSW